MKNNSHVRALPAHGCSLFYTYEQDRRYTRRKTDVLSRRELFMKENDRRCGRQHEPAAVYYREKHGTVHRSSKAEVYCVV